MVLGVAALIVLALLALGRRRGDELEVAITLPQGRFLQGKPIPMRFVVKNVSAHAVDVDRWQPAGDAASCASLTGMPVDLALYYEILPKPILRATPEPGSAGVGPLAPGASMSFDCDVALLFGLIKPGEYRLAASYVRDRRAQRPWLRLPGRWWSSIEEHPLVPFTVLSRIYDEKNDKTTKAGELIR